MVDTTSIKLSEINTNLLTREQGESVRRVIEGRLASSASGHIEVDFDGVVAITPSFVDECLGRLLLKIGLDLFRERIRLSAADKTVQRLVNRVLAHRQHGLTESPS